MPWLDERQPDVVCLQEIKLTREAFTELLGAELTARGYEFAVHGQPQFAVELELEPLLEQAVIARANTRPRAGARYNRCTRE